jgi:hypothetical protein
MKKVIFEKNLYPYKRCWILIDTFLIGCALVKLKRMDSKSLLNSDMKKAIWCSSDENEIFFADKLFNELPIEILTSKKEEIQKEIMCNNFPYNLSAKIFKLSVK